MEKKLRVTEDERDKVFEEFQTAEEKLLAAEETATKVSHTVAAWTPLTFSLLSLPPVLSLSLSPVSCLLCCLCVCVSFSLPLSRPVCALTLLPARSPLKTNPKKTQKPVRVTETRLSSRTIW